MPKWYLNALNNDDSVQAVTNEFIFLNNKQCLCEGAFIGFNQMKKQRIMQWQHYHTHTASHRNSADSIRLFLPDYHIALDICENKSYSLFVVGKNCAQ